MPVSEASEAVRPRERELPVSEASEAVRPRERELLMTGERAAERVRVDAFVKVHGADGQELVFRTRDLSEHGLFLYTRVARAYPFKVGSTLALELYDYDQHVACKVVVVRVVESGTDESNTFPTGFGVKIVDLDETSRACLTEMINRIKSGEVY